MQLKPCPFCGCEAVFWWNREYGVPFGDDGWRASISCKNPDCAARITRWALKKDWAA